MLIIIDERDSIKSSLPRRMNLPIITHARRLGERDAQERQESKIDPIPPIQLARIQFIVCIPRERCVGVSSGGLDPMSSSYSRPCWQTLLCDIAPAANRGSIQLTEELAFPSKFRARSLANLFEKISIPVSSLFYCFHFQRQFLVPDAKQSFLLLLLRRVELRFQSNSPDGNFTETFDSIRLG